MICFSLSVGKSWVRTTEKQLFFKKVLFFSGKSGYNIGVMCSFLLFAEDFRGLSAKFAIAIYPRKGTETQRSTADLQRPELQFIPARGRKPFAFAHAFKPLILQFIPARGRKQPAMGRTAGAESIAIYPRKGTETRPYVIDLSVIHIAIYPRKGTETPTRQRMP